MPRAAIGTRELEAAEVIFRMAVVELPGYSVGAEELRAKLGSPSRRCDIRDIAIQLKFECTRLRDERKKEKQASRETETSTEAKRSTASERRRE